MSAKQSQNSPASINQRLLDLSKRRNEDFNLILIWYAIERLLYRLSFVEQADQFVLKGAMLFSVWTGKIYRPTRDLDLLGVGNESKQQLTSIFRKICEVEVEPDGLSFDAKSIKILDIREEQTYGGLRVKLSAKLGNARIRLQIDVAFGDIITPAVKNIEYPTLLDLPAPRILAYPRETVVAEKLEAIVSLGVLNSRMKDYYDLWVISKQFSLNGEILAKAIRSTFTRRKTVLPNDVPSGLSDLFATDKNKIVQWKAFIKRSRVSDPTVELNQVIDDLRLFLVPPLAAATENVSFKQSWQHGEQWS